MFFFRYLFFLHRRPEHGPMRVQLTNPVSRFKHVQSLQHMCRWVGCSWRGNWCDLMRNLNDNHLAAYRFVILKAVIRKDLIQTLPLPRRLLDYLNYKHCYSEQVESDSSHSQVSPLTHNSSLPKWYSTLFRYLATVPCKTWQGNGRRQRWQQDTMAIR